MSAEAKKARLTRELRDSQLREVLSTPAGRALVWRLITSVAGAFGSSFSSDSHLSAFNEGKRAVGLSLMRESQRVAPASYLEMMHERIGAEQLALEPEKEDPEPDASGDSSTD